MGFGGSSGSSSISSANDAVINIPSEGQSLTYTSSKWRNIPAGVNSQVIVRWDSATTSWSVRPAGAQWGVLFLSTNDPAATAPTDVNLAAGDRWLRHPNAS